MLHAHWTAYQWSTSAYLKLPALSVVAGEMRLGSGWLRLDPWILQNPSGSSMGSLHRITLASAAVGWVGVGVLLVAPAAVVLAFAVAEGGEAGTAVSVAVLGVASLGRGNGTMGDHYASEWHLDVLLEHGRLASGTCSTSP